MHDRMSAADYQRMVVAKHGGASSGPKFGERIKASDLNALLTSGALTSKTLGIRASATAPDAAPGSSKSSATAAEQREPNQAPKKRNSQPEFDEQCQLFSWARDEIVLMAHPELKLLSSSLNGVKLSKAQAGKAKAAGMLQGESDVRLPIARGPHIGLLIEMKYGKNKATKEQLDYGQLMTDEGHQFHVCYSCQEAQDVILDYIALPRPVRPHE